MTARDVRIDPDQAEDTYLGKVSRYISAEIVAAYIAASSIVLGGENIPQVTLLWIVIAVLGVLTPLWLLYATDVPEKPKAVF